MNLVTEIYKISNSWLLEKDRWLKDQIRRSAVSIPSNIAEWNDRSSDAEFKKFLYYAKWSCAEVLVQLQIAVNIWYMNEDEISNIVGEYESIIRMIWKLISTLSVQ